MSKRKLCGEVALALLFGVQVVVISGSSHSVAGWTLEIIALLLTLLASATLSEWMAKRPSSSESMSDGDYAIKLDRVEGDRVRLVKVIREVTGMKLTAAKNIVDSAPSLIIAGLDEPCAKNVVSRLEKAGASVQVVGQDESN